MNSQMILLMGIIVAIILIAILWLCYFCGCFGGHIGLQTDGYWIASPEEELVVVVEPKSVKRRIEKSIFDKSFELIEKSNPRYRGLKNAYTNAYNSSVEGKIDWHTVFPKLKSKGNGYISAIIKTSSLLPKKDSKEKREIYSLVDKLIKIRVEENAKFIGTQNKSFSEHKHAIEVWSQFKK